jgi:formylglycine-generating enzyme required for sulfatase activity
LLSTAERSVVERALAKKAADRWPSCRAFAQALAASVSGQPVRIVASESPTTVVHLPTPKSTVPKPATARKAGMGGRLAVGALFGALAVVLTVFCFWLASGPRQTLSTEKEVGQKTPNQKSDRHAQEKDAGKKSVTSAADSHKKAPAPARLSLFTAPRLAITAGRSSMLDVEVQRHDCAGAVEVEVVDLPDKVECQPLILAADQTRGQLHLKAASGAAGLTKTAHIRAKLGTLHEEREVEVTLTGAPALRVVVSKEVRLRAGESCKVAITVERQNCPGPIELALAPQDLPAGVSQRPAQIPPDANAGEVELSAKADVKEGSKKVRLTAKGPGVRKDASFQLLIIPTAKVARTMRNTIGMELVLIPKGRFRMGSPEDEVGRWPNEGPVHDVEIRASFYMGACPVTIGQFRAFVKATNYKTAAEQDGKGGQGYNKDTRRWNGYKPEFSWHNTGWEQTDDHPVVNIAWQDAVKFCEWLSARERKHYRLPTEAEWEYACRGKTKPEAKATRFWFGDDEAGLQSAANVMDQSLKAMLNENFARNMTFAPWSDGCPFTNPVAVNKKTNPFGLHGMHGNVRQLCEDLWHKNYDGAPSDERAWLEGGEPNRHVIRGGSWHHGPKGCRSATRSMIAGGQRSCSLGFRVVLAPP